MRFVVQEKNIQNLKLAAQYYDDNRYDFRSLVKAGYPIILFHILINSKSEQSENDVKNIITALSQIEMQRKRNTSSYDQFLSILLSKFSENISLNIASNDVDQTVMNEINDFLQPANLMFVNGISFEVSNKAFQSFVSLPKEVKTIWTLLLLDYCSIREIAQICNQPTKTIETYLSYTYPAISRITSTFVPDSGYSPLLVMQTILVNSYLITTASYDYTVEPIPQPSSKVKSTKQKTNISKTSANHSTPPKSKSNKHKKSFKQGPTSQEIEDRFWRRQNRIATFYMIQIPFILISLIHLPIYLMHPSPNSMLGSIEHVLWIYSCVVLAVTFYYPLIWKTIKPIGKFLFFGILHYSDGIAGLESDDMIDIVGYFFFLFIRFIIIGSPFILWQMLFPDSVRDPRFVVFLTHCPCILSVISWILKFLFSPACCGFLSRDY